MNPIQYVEVYQPGYRFTLPFKTLRQAKAYRREAEYKTGLVYKVRIVRRKRCNGM